MQQKFFYNKQNVTNVQRTMYWVLLITFFILLIVTIINVYVDKKSIKPIEIVQYILFFSFLILLLVRKKKQFFIEITGTDFKWFVLHNEKDTPKIKQLFWNDVQWIKFEDGGCCFYEQSSFVNFVELNKFLSVQDAQAVKSIIIIEAAKRNIKIIEV